MSFLFPIALGGVVLIGVPILVHLILRQKPQTLLFPAFRFLLQRHRTNQRKLRLRHFALLALRMLILLALFLALAQPLLFSTGAGWSGDHPVAVVFVVDTSPRMGYKASDGTTRLDLAREKARKLLGELHADSKVLILDSGVAPPTGKSGEKAQNWAASIGSAESILTGLKVRPSSRSLGEQIQYGLERLDGLARDNDEPRNRTLPRFLCVFSDRTRGTWKASSQDDLARAVAKIPPAYDSLKAVQGELPELIDLVKEVQTKLSGEVTYGDQTLLDALNQLQGDLVSLPPEEVSATNKLAAVPAILQHGRELARQVRAGKAKSEEKDYRDRLLQRLDSVMGKLRGVECLFFDVGLEEPVDLAIVRIETPRLSDDTPQQVFARNETWVLRVVARASGKDQSATVVLKLPTETLEATVDFPAGKETTVPFEIDSDKLKGEAGFVQMEAGFKVPDLLPFNNQAFLTIALREPRKVLVIADNEKMASPFVAALDALGFLPEVKTPEETTKLDKIAYPAVFLFQATKPGAALWTALERYVAGGGALGVVPGGDEMLLKEADPDAYDGPIAQRVLPGRIQKKVEVKDPGAAWDLEDETIYQHSLLRPFRLWRKGNIDFIRFPRGAFQYWEVEPFREAQVLVRYADEKNRPALLELPPDPKINRQGKVLLFTTPLDVRTPRWNNYLESLTSFYIVLTGLSTNYLAGDMERLTLNFTTDQPRPPYWTLAPGKSYVGYQLNGPGLRRDLGPPEKDNVLDFPDAKTPGNYILDGLLRGGVKERVGAFSLNLPAREGDLSRLEEGVIEDVFGTGSVLPVDHTTEARELLKGSRNEPLRLLPILMLAMLFLLAGENLLANLFYRRS